MRPFPTTVRQPDAAARQLAAMLAVVLVSAPTSALAAPSAYAAGAQAVTAAPKQIQAEATPPAETGSAEQFQFEASPAVHQAASGQAASGQAASGQGTAGSATPSQVQEGLTCQCGCGLTVANCNHLQCGFAVPVKEDIADSLARGDSAEQILARYRAEYGEKILSSPVAEGFNVMAWITPYAAVGTGALLLLVAIRRWAGTPGDPESDGPVTPMDDEQRNRLRRELEDYEA